MLQFVCTQQDFFMLDRNHNNTVTMQVMYEHRNALNRVARKDLIAFDRYLKPGSFVFDSLQEVLRLLDMLKTCSSGP